jgi:hypothetical protein
MKMIEILNDSDENKKETSNPENEISELSPLLEKLLKESSFEAKPLPMLLVGMFSMYLLNFYEMLND